MTQAAASAFCRSLTLILPPHTGPSPALSTFQIGYWWIANGCAVRKPCPQRSQMKTGAGAKSAGIRRHDIGGAAVPAAGAHHQLAPGMAVRLRYCGSRAGGGVDDARIWTGRRNSQGAIRVANVPALIPKLTVRTARGDANAVRRCRPSRLRMGHSRYRSENSGE